MYDAGILDTLTDEITHTDSKFPFKKMHMFPNVCKKRNQICGNCFCIPTLGLSRYLSPKIKLITTQVSALSIIGDALRVQNKTTHPFYLSLKQSASFGISL